MEIISFLQEVQNYIPKEYHHLSSEITNSMPYVFLIIGLATCFSGYQLHKFWIKLCMSIFAFLLGAFTGIFFPSVSINWFIGFGILLAGLSIYFSKQLYKAQLFLLNALFSYLWITALLSTFLPNFATVILGLILSIFIGILAMKYIYIITIITTSISGAFMTSDQFSYFFALDQKSLLYLFSLILFSFLGIFVQFKYHLPKKSEN